MAAPAKTARGGSIDPGATATGQPAASVGTAGARTPSAATPAVGDDSNRTVSPDTSTSDATIASGTSGPLTVHPTNPRYFADATGQAIYLTGSHTWSNLQDEWTNSYNVSFDYEAYLDLLVANNHNFIRLWRLELPKYMYEGDGEFRFAEPHPWLRVGNGSVNGTGGSTTGSAGGGDTEPGSPTIDDNGDTAIDTGGVTAPPVSTRGPISVGGAGGTTGKIGGGTSGGGGGGMALALAPTPGQGKFDLTQFNQAYFDRLRERVQMANERGIYVSIMLFEGHGLSHTQEGWSSHPFNSNNNVNGINGDVNGDGLGDETHTLENPAALAIQEAYVKKVIDTVNDLDNVLFEIANESTGDSVEWQNHMIDVIENYQQTLPQQHPVLFSTPLANVGDAIWTSDAQAVSPIAYSPDGSYADDPPAADGTKVVLSDSDHIFGCGGSADWVWRSFTRGLNVIYMDSYYEDTPFCPPPSEDIRANLGFTNDYALRMDLSQTLPMGELSSTGFALVDAGDSYLVYLPEGGSATVDLSGAVSGEAMPVEWLNIATGEVIAAASTSGGSNQTFQVPFEGQAVLFIGGSAPTPPSGDGGDDGGVATPVPTTKVPGAGGGVGGGVMMGDLDGNNLVNIEDAKILVEQWGDCPTADQCTGDLDQDSKVDLSDLIKMLNQWTG